MARKKKNDARSIFDRSLAVCSTHLERVEHQLKKGSKSSALDPEVIKATRELGALVNSMTKTQESLNAKGMAKVGNMSLAEQFDVALRFVLKLPVGYRQQALEALQESLAKAAA